MRNNFLDKFHKKGVRDSDSDPVSRGSGSSEEKKNRIRIQISTGGQGSGSGQFRPDRSELLVASCADLSFQTCVHSFPKALHLGIMWHFTD